MAAVSPVEIARQQARGRARRPAHELEIDPSDPRKMVVDDDRRDRRNETDRGGEQRFGDPDVLRGEEVAASGALEQSGGRAGLFLSVPGMHGKWLAHDGKQITQFHTSMTVELYRVLAERSVLAPLMAAEPSEGAAFREGVVRGAEGGGLGRLLFAARSNVQAGRMPADDAASFLWGIVIGSDVRENMPLAPRATCLVAGAPAVASLFAAAIRQLGGAAEVRDGDQLTAAGFLRLAALLRAKGMFA